MKWILRLIVPLVVIAAVIIPTAEAAAAATVACGYYTDLPIVPHDIDNEVINDQVRYEVAGHNGDYAVLWNAAQGIRGLAGGSGVQASAVAINNGWAAVNVNENGVSHAGRWTTSTGVYYVLTAQFPAGSHATSIDYQGNLAGDASVSGRPGMFLWPAGATQTRQAFNTTESWHAVGNLNSAVAFARTDARATTTAVWRSNLDQIIGIPGLPGGTSAWPVTNIGDSGAAMNASDASGRRWLLVRLQWAKASLQPVTRMLGTVGVNFWMDDVTQNSFRAVGVYQRPGETFARVVVRSDYDFHEIGLNDVAPTTMPPDPNQMEFDINGNGRIVGHYRTTAGTQRNFMWLYPNYNMDGCPPAGTSVPPTYSIEGTTVTEGQRAKLKVRIDHEVSWRTFVDFHTVSGTATDPEDYWGRTNRVEFQPGETEKEIYVDTKTDGIAEPTENFQVKLYGAYKAVETSATATVQVRDASGV